LAKQLFPKLAEVKTSAAKAADACKSLFVNSHLTTPGGAQLTERHYVFSLAQRSLYGAYRNIGYSFLEMPTA
jgi:hypothetical protein